MAYKSQVDKIDDACYGQAELSTTSNCFFREEEMRKAEQIFGNLLEALKPAVARSTMTALLEWDEATQCPAQAEEHRAALSGLAAADEHRAFIDPAVNGALTKALAVKDRLPALKRRIIERLADSYRRATALPTDFVQEQAEAVTESQRAWKLAKEAKDFSLFAPHLRQVLDFVRREAVYYGAQPGDGVSMYDALLGANEPGHSLARTERLMSAVRDWLVPFRRRLDVRSRSKPIIFGQPFPREQQLQLNRQLLTDFGFDFSRGVLATSVHPFTISIGPDDVRLTTAIDETSIASVFSTAHEAGHAMFDQGRPALLDRCNLFTCSLGVHESQSRLWENMVGHSQPFCRYLWPKLASAVPDSLPGSAEDLYRAVNDVRPSPIRIDADEVTYNLHILLRVELEVDLLAGRLAVEDLAQAFADKMGAYLGLRPKDDAAGVLQDIHWSEGTLTYFETYTSGDLGSAQLFAQYERDNPRWPEEFAAGDFSSLRRWLGHTVYPHGHTMDIDALMTRVTGEPLNPEHWFRHLEQKYLPLYTERSD